MNVIYFLIFFSLTVGAQAQNNKRFTGEAYARKELKKALTNKTQHNLVDHKSAIIKDSATAIKVAESILFNIYGKPNITKQQPYETFLINKYWIIKGTLDKDSYGGTFLIIIDSRDSKIIRITHGR